MKAKTVTPAAKKADTKGSITLISKTAAANNTKPAPNKVAAKPGAVVKPVV